MTAQHADLDLHHFEPAGIIKAVLGFRHFSMRGLDKVAGEWNLMALAYNCKRLHKLKIEMAS